MNTRFRCIVPTPNIANWRASSASWRTAASSPDRGEASCSSPYRSMSGLPISTVRRRENAGRDRRDARMDAVGASRAFAIRDVAAGAQALTISWAVEGWPWLSRTPMSAVHPHGQPGSIPSRARTMAAALPRQTMAWAARCAPMQLSHKQKIPTEPRTSAIPNNATRDKRSVKFMRFTIRICR